MPEEGGFKVNPPFVGEQGEQGCDCLKALYLLVQGNLLSWFPALLLYPGCGTPGGNWARPGTLRYRSHPKALSPKLCDSTRLPGPTLPICTEKAQTFYSVLFLQEQTKSHGKFFKFFVYLKKKSRFLASLGESGALQFPGLHISR